VSQLALGCSPFFEPGLPEALKQVSELGRIQFLHPCSVPDVTFDLAFVAVDTPEGSDGLADTLPLLQAVQWIEESLHVSGAVIVRSTVPIGFMDQLHGRLSKSVRSRSHVGIVYNPEFMREGTALSDFLNAERVVIGASDLEHGDQVRRVYEALGRPIVVTDFRTAELIKYASNAYLAMSISFANEIADVSAAFGCNLNTVLSTLAMDSRIASAYLQPGAGFGGGCLAKDVKCLTGLMRQRGHVMPLVSSVLEVNSTRIDRAVTILTSALGGLSNRTVVVLGISFKANTDDIRNSPGLELVRVLLSHNAIVRVHDPVALSAFERTKEGHFATAVPELGAAILGADAIAIMTAWPEYEVLPAILSSSKVGVLFDGRGVLSPTTVTISGWAYRSFG
jgi:UDPglucose 6-dehydrogenase